MEVMEDFLEKVMLEQSLIRRNGRGRAFGAEGAAWASVFLGGPEGCLRHRAPRLVVQDPGAS